MSNYETNDEMLIPHERRIRTCDVLCNTGDLILVNCFYILNIQYT